MIDRSVRFLAALFTLLLLPSLAGAEKVEFRFKSPGGSGVFLAGDFNNWNPTGQAMTDEDGDGIYTVTVDLPPGKYQYKFVAGGNWYADPNAKNSTDDGFGGKNSVVTVGGSADAGGFVDGTTSAGGAGKKAAGAAGVAAGAGAGTGTAAGAVTFRWTPDAKIGQAHVAGAFNSWNTSATPMSDADGDGTWEATVDLTPGRYAYKFVADGTNWHTDPNAAETEDDGYGGKNSVITVGGAGAPAKPKAATPAATGAGPAAAGDGVLFRWTPGKAYGQVFVAGEFNDWSTSATPMSDADGDGTWEAVVPLPAGKYQYKFVADGNWVADPNAAATMDDGFGGENSVVEVKSDGTVAGGGGGGGTGVPKTAAAPAAGGPGVDVTFKYQPVISGIGTLHLVGEFNGWDQTATPMSDADGDGTWEVTLPLAPGKYPYKFLVDGVNWLEDPNAQDSVDDGYGGKNSLITVGAKGAQGPGQPRRVKFAHKPSGQPGEISLAGTFNNWTVGKTPMTDEDGDGTYEVTLLLPEDTYQYKFVVDGNWITDRSASDFVDDGFGGQNSVLVVDHRFSGIDLATGDGKIFTDGLQHRQTAGEVNRVADDRLTFTVKTYQNDVEEVVVAWKRADGRGGGSVLLAPVATDPTYQYWQGSLTDPAGVPDLSYEILYRDGDAEILQNGTGSFERIEPDTENLDRPMFVYSEEAFPRFTTPDWVRNGVIYQIFPERFANGDKSNDPDFSEEYYDGRTSLPAGGKTNGEYYHLVEDWNDFGGLAKSPYRTDGKPDYFSFYGGDIAGLRQKLDYLEDLGVTILYFNPLFQARSNHKYEAYDYLSIDPHFGTPEEFRTFVDESHARGIRIVADWVINHIGDHSPYFQDTVKKGKDSEYWNWFEWNKWPLPAREPTDWTEYYECWWGFAHMPDLNYDLSRRSSQENGVARVEDADVNWPVVNYVLESARWWLQDLDIDGFRLDVPNEVPFWVWKIFRDEVRRIKPDAYLVGEIWSDAGDWVSPDCFDATMNYKYFKDPVTDFIGHGRINASRFDQSLQAGRMAYPMQATEVMMNLVGSHDTPRYLHAIGGDQRRQRLTALFAMTYVGAPHIYYGDEIAMTGGADPDCRRPFRWNWQDDPQRAAMHDWYRKLIHLRKEHPALTTGEYRTLVAEGPVYAFARMDAEEAFVVVLNVGDRDVDVDIPALNGVRWEDVLGGGKVDSAGGTIRVKVGAVSGRILQRIASSS